jgi:hypothetical protein
VTPVLAAVLVDQTLPPSLVTPLAIAGAVLAALLSLAWLAFRPGGPPALLKRGLALAGGLVAVWAGASLAVALRVHALQDDLAGRQAAFASLGAHAAAGLESLASPVGTCADSLEVAGATSLVGYLVVPPRAGVPREQLPRPGYPRLLVPTDAGAVVITSVPAPPKAAEGLPSLFLRTAFTPPWGWSGLLARPSNPLTAVRYVVAASVRSYDARGHRLDCAVRVVPTGGGAPVCEGSYSVKIPPGASAQSPLASALEASAFSAICRAGGTTFVDHVTRYAPLAPAPSAGP